MNIDLNAAAAHAYELAHQMANQYSAYGTGTTTTFNPVMYAKKFYEYLISDTSSDFEARLQGLKIAVGHNSATLQKSHSETTAKNIANLLEFSKRIEYNTRGHAGAMRAHVSLGKYQPLPCSPDDIIKSANQEAERYTHFLKQASTNTWDEDSIEGPLGTHHQQVIELIVKRMTEDKNVAEKLTQDIVSAFNKRRM